MRLPSPPTKLPKMLAAPPPAIWAPPTTVPPTLLPNFSLPELKVESPQLDADWPTVTRELAKSPKKPAWAGSGAERSAPAKTRMETLRPIITPVP